MLNTSIMAKLFKRAFKASCAIILTKAQVAKQLVISLSFYAHKYYKNAFNFYNITLQVLVYQF